MFLDEARQRKIGKDSRNIGPARGTLALRALGFAAVVALTLALASSCTLAQAPKATRKVIIDTDPGTDDAIAILLALNSPELDVRALTVVPGNVTAEQGLKNALTLASLANRCDIPIAGGAQHPLFQKTIIAEFWHGKNGLADVPTPPIEMQSRSTLRPPT